MPSPQTALPLHTEALVAPVRGDGLRQFYRGFSARHASVRGPRDPARRIVAGVGIAAGAVGVLAIIFGITEEIREGAPDVISQVIGMASIVAALVVGAVALIWWQVRTRRRRGTPLRHFRLARFAADNGLSYDPGPYSATHLTPWADRGRVVVTRLMRTRSGRRVEFANYELAYGPAARRHTEFGGYCAVRLRTRLPHIVLQSTGNVASRLSSRSVPARSQRLSLEGDFDSHFLLHCPEGYERDALYLFTPDVMARLIDSVSGFDVEVVDDWLFLTRTKDVVTLDPETWMGLVAATDALSEKIGRWERWREDRPLDPAPTQVNPAAAGTASARIGEVAVTGRRLQMSVGRGTIIWIAACTVSLAAIVIASLLQ